MELVTVTPMSTVAKTKGTPKGDAGLADSGACQDFADAYDGILDQHEQEVTAGQDPSAPADVADGLLDAGHPFGCVFTQQ